MTARKELVNGQITVLCEEKTCDWREEAHSIEEVRAWANKNCPKCGHGPVINEDGLALLNRIEEFMTTMDTLVSGHIETDGKVPSAARRAQSGDRRFGPGAGL